MWASAESVMVVVEVVAALCAVAVCGPCLLAAARRLLLGAEALRGPAAAAEAAVAGCDEPRCPYYKKKVRYLVVPARRRRHYASPPRPAHPARPARPAS